MSNTSPTLNGRPLTSYPIQTLAALHRDAVFELEQPEKHREIGEYLESREEDPSEREQRLYMLADRRREHDEIMAQAEGKD
jgi:hypothetical protein